MTLRALGDAVGRWFPLIVVLAGAVALAAPGVFSPMTVAVPWLLAVIMLGMGMTLTGRDFAIVGRKPGALAVGVVAQYVVMPLVGLGVATVLDLSPDLAAGVILVGCAPGGTASNVMVFLSRGDTALSVAMTSVSTLLAPLLTPVLVLLLAGQFLPVDAGELLVSIVQIVLLPVVLGLFLRRLLPGAVERSLGALPLVSVAGITLVVMAVVAASADTLLSVGLAVVAAVVVHNLAGYALGYAAGRSFGLDEPGKRAVSIEVGMQNSGLAAALATAHFSPAAALPGAIFSVWHNVSGSLLAGYWSRKTQRAEAERVAV
ncbi:MAG TPA: bile acid:sodium symporter family protein [Nocardioidaceae bacterium]|nr:bile acid:sodium symporter family protein [Nocardioidaceae bacterium]